MDSLRKDLLELVDAAIDVWNNAQTGSFNIIVSPTLKHKNLEE
jgi:hypothetical protein